MVNEPAWRQEIISGAMFIQAIEVIAHKAESEQAKEKADDEDEVFHDLVAKFQMQGSPHSAQ